MFLERILFQSNERKTGENIKQSIKQRSDEIIFKYMPRMRADGLPG